MDPVSADCKTHTSSSPLVTVLCQTIRWATNHERNVITMYANFGDDDAEPVEDKQRARIIMNNATSDLHNKV